MERESVFRTEEEAVVSIQTRRSTKGRWRNVALKGEVERAALLPVVTSKDVRPFGYRSSRYIIAPTQEDGLGGRRLCWGDGIPHRDTEFPNTLKFWKRAEKIYQQNRAATAGHTLLDNLDWKRTLSAQFGEVELQGTRRLLKVVINKSGKSGLKASRIPASHIADDMLYYVICVSNEEALYLCGILNAPCMQDTWNRTKTSIMHYDKNPWRKVPIQSYDRRNQIHCELARCAQAAEEDFSHDVKGRLNQLVVQLLPEYT